MLNWVKQNIQPSLDHLTASARLIIPSVTGLQPR